MLMIYYLSLQKGQGCTINKIQILLYLYLIMHLHCMSMMMAPQFHLSSYLGNEMQVIIFYFVLFTGFQFFKK